MTTNSIIPTKVSVVKKLAALELDYQRKALRSNLENLAQIHHDEAVAQNRSFFRKLFNKFVEVPDPEKLVEQWYAEHAAGTLYWETAAGMKFSRVETCWWQRLKQLECLPIDGDQIMLLSVDDAQLIRLNKRWEQAQ